MTMEFEAVSLVIEVLALLFAALTFFMEWPRFQTRLRESVALKVVWNVFVPIFILAMSVSSYFVLLFFVGSISTQTPLPHSTGKTIGYVILSSMLLGQLFLAKVKVGEESQKFVRHAYITVFLIVFLAISSYFSDVFIP